MKQLFLTTLLLLCISFVRSYSQGDLVLFETSNAFIRLNNPISGADSLKTGNQPSIQPNESIWTIGIYTGSSPFNLSSPLGIKNPVLTASDVNDMNVDVVAHPFMIKTDSMYYMFFTAKDKKTDKGGIGMAQSKDGFNWKYRHKVIGEQFVLSYPYVFRWNDDYYMIPESHTASCVRLYKAVKFPDKWEFKCNLLTGSEFISSTVVRYKDMWWMFTSIGGNDNLKLYYSTDLNGPWTEHPQSPIVKNNLRTARSAGRPFIMNGNLYRLGQDCYPTYGNQVHAFQIIELTTKSYVEKMIVNPLVKSSSKGWNAEAMHHVDAYQIDGKRWIAVVDALGK